MNKLLVVCGPTATGKTQLALDLAKRFNGELISADSRQVYCGMDIGTGKDVGEKSRPKADRPLDEKIKFKNQLYELIPCDINGIPLWMYDVVNPDEEFSVAHYQSLAKAVIENMRKRGKLPIMVGGTGLYIASLLSPLETSHIPPNMFLRKTLQVQTIQELQERLKKEDTILWDKLNISDRQNPRRLMRKIEIATFKRKKDINLPAGEAGMRRDNEYDEKDILLIGLTAPYPVLYKRIDERVEKRVKEGIAREIQTLLKKGYSWDLPSMNTFGYKEWKDFFILPHNSCLPAGRALLIPLVIQRWKWDEHGYARRQMAWFKKMKGIQWIDISQGDWMGKVETMVSEWYT